MSVWAFFRDSWLVQLVSSAARDWAIAALLTGPVPQHMAFIMDGNRRYAREKDMALKEGHLEGARLLAEVLNACFELGISTVTVYAFLIENFSRPQAEVDTLLGMVREQLAKLHRESLSQNRHVRIRIVGNRLMIPDDILGPLEEIEALCPANHLHTINVCFPYTLRDDIAHSVRSVMAEVDAGTLVPDSISVQTLQDHMYLGAGLPPVDIMVRTGGHTRMSDFMLWQLNETSSVEFVAALWPHFRFWLLARVVFRWSYYTTLQRQGVGQHRASPRRHVRLHDLPAAPPLASVTEL